MAIELELALENGVTTSYHRVVGTEIDYIQGIAKIKVESYVSQAQRQLEIDEAQVVKDFKQLRAQLDELVANPTEDNEQERIDLSDQINAIVETTGEPTVTSRSVDTKEVERDMEDGVEYTRETIYDVLTSEGEVFEGGIKV